jgi:hypothetical protein
MISFLNMVLRRWIIVSDYAQNGIIGYTAAKTPKSAAINHFSFPRFLA